MIMIFMDFFSINHIYLRHLRSIVLCNVHQLMPDSTINTLPQVAIFFS